MASNMIGWVNPDRLFQSGGYGGSAEQPVLNINKSVYSPRWLVTGNWLSIPDAGTVKSGVVMFVAVHHRVIYRNR